MCSGLTLFRRQADRLWPSRRRKPSTVVRSIRRPEWESRVGRFPRGRPPSRLSARGARMRHMRTREQDGSVYGVWVWLGRRRRRRRRRQRREVDADVVDGRRDCCCDRSCACCRRGDRGGGGSGRGDDAFSRPAVLAGPRRNVECAEAFPVGASSAPETSLLEAGLRLISH
jgi:hypothetical protein